MMTRILGLLLMVVVCAANGPKGPSTTDLCQAAASRAERVRVKMGYAPGPPMPYDPLLRREACLLALKAPEEDIRRVLLEAEVACGLDDCRWLLPKRAPNRLKRDPARN